MINQKLMATIDCTLEAIKERLVDSINDGKTYAEDGYTAFAVLQLIKSLSVPIDDNGSIVPKERTVSRRDLHAVTCEELLEARVILNTRDLASVKITNSGRSVEFLAFFADSFGILDECLKDMYDCHLDEVDSVEEKMQLELKAHEAQQTIDNSVWED